MPGALVRMGGAERVLAVPAGQSLMQAIRAAGQPGFGECSGSLACATCHVVVDAAWAGRLPPPSEDEEAMLDTVFDLQAGSRLGCQVVMLDALDGIRVTVPPSE